MKKHVLSLLIIGFAASSVAPLTAADPRRGNNAAQIMELDYTLRGLRRLEGRYAETVRQIEAGEIEGNLMEARTHLKDLQKQIERTRAQLRALEQAR